jgi:hypothetical protein
MRSARNFGARRLQTELMRLHGVSLSLATIHKVLSTHQVKPIKKFRRKLSMLVEEGDMTEVYNLNIQFFPLTVQEREKKPLC